MKLLKRGAVLIGALLMTLLMSVGVFADEAWTKADVTNSSIGVSKQTTELKSLSYIADEGISLNVDNDKVSVSGKGIGTGSTVYVSNSTDTETGLANATYNKVDNGAKTGIVYFDSKKIDVRHVTSYFNIKIETGSKSTVIKVKTTVAYGDLYVYAFQMNTKHNDGAVSEYNPSYRVVNYCGNVLAKGNDLIPVRGFGTVYGINGTFTKNDLVKNSSNANVYSFDATEQGLVDVKNATQWDNYYAVTFKNLSYNPELLDRSYTLRPYAILEDGSIMYSDDVQSTSIYDVANVLYERNAMSTKEARTFLYKHILNIVKLKNNYVNICKNMLHVLNVTDANSADYKFVNALYKDLYCYAQLTQNYENAHYYDRDNFVAKTFVDGQDPNTVLLDKLNKAAETDYDTILDWINFESPKNGVEGGYVPAGVYENGKLTKDWSDLVKDGDVVVDDETLKSVSDNVNGDLQLPESIKKIESAKGSNLDTVTVPSTVEEISDDAFTEVPKVIYNGDATGARWGADITIVKGNSIKIPVYAGYNSNNKTLYFAKTAKELEDAGVTENYGDISSVGFTKYNSAPWYSINWQITKVNFLSEIKPTSCSYWFYCFTSLADIDNIQNLNTKNVTNMSYMFSYCGALTSLDVSNFDTSKVTRMDWMFYNCYILTSLDLSNFDTRKVTDMSYMLGLCNEVTSLDVSNFDTSKVTRMNGMFSGCRALTTLNVSNFDTSKVTDMSSMFSYCSKLTTLDVSNFDTSKVAYMGSMFDGCTSLTTLNISNFDTSKVTSMNYMFSGCSALTTLDVSNFDTSKVTSMNYMFGGCSKLTSLDISNFDTSKVTDMSSMFSNCSSLTTLKLGVFNTSKSSYSSIFSGMRANATLYTISPNTKNWILKLSSSDRPSIWTSDNIKVYCNKNEAGHNFEIITTDQTCTEDGKQTKTCTYCGYKEETILKAGHDFKVVTNENGKELICSRCNEHREYDDYVIDIISNTNYIQDGNKFTSNIKGVSKGNSSIELKLTFYKTTTLNFKYKVSSESSCDKGSLVIDGITIADKISGTNKAEQIYSRTFEPGTYTITSQYTKDSTTDKGDDCFYFSLNNPIFAGYNASNNTLYFANKQSEIKNTGIDLTSDNYYGDISKIDFTSTSAPWGNNSNITQITFLSEIKPTSCAYWFYDFDKLTGIDNIQNLNTSNVTNMCYMFNNCSKLTTLDLSNLNTSKVTDMSYMFSYCSKLTTLDVSNFDTSKATRMNGMFNNCSSLTTLDVSNFDTRNVTYMSSMFSNCSKLTTLDLSSFDTSKVTDISSMFFNCTSLTTLNVSNFDTNRVTNMNSMFNSCTSLTTLDVSNFDISKVTSMNSMFNSCTSLTTLDVSNFDTSKVTDMSYMFSGCSSLTSLDISDFDTSKVTYMSGMFNNCSSLTTLDVSNFNTSKVTDMSSMFSGCSKLTTLDVSNFDTSKVTHMSYIFYNCSSLITLKLGIFNTSKVSSYSNIFSKINSNTILYTYSQNTKDWILNLSSSNRPSSWTTDNIKVICSKNESGHNFETITTEPTCTENGKQVKTCTYCGYKEEIVLKAGHNFEVVTNNEGNKELVCSRCNEHREYHDYTIDIISNTNYVQDNNKFTSNIKGVNNGKSSIELTLTVYETTNFNFKYKVSSESRYDKGSLTIDGVTVADAISGTSNSEQTYTKILVPGTYTITSSYMKDSSANNGDDCFYFTVECGHIWDNGTITKEPTCTEAGTKVYKCTNDDCDVTKTETIKALGHNWDNGIVTKEPTCTDTGTKICTCSRDNVTKTETIKALGHDYNDNNVCTRCNDKLENPIFVGYSSSDNTLYFASKQKEIKNAGIDLTSDNYYGDISKINFASTSAPWENNSNITQITFLSEIKPTSCSYWFYKLDGLTKINNIKNLNTENCTKMNGMFDGCSKLTSLDLSDFDTSKVTSMRAMFTNCYGLKTINLSNFDTSNVKNMGSMFYCCSNLTSLDLSNFNTGNVTDMRYMFLACSDLTSLDVNNFDTSNVTNMSAMFEECVSLTTIDVSNFNTSKVTDMSSMFDGGFGGHNSLTTLDLSNFDTSNVTDMSNMFSKCTSLTTLDISSFNTNKVTNLSDMFSKCNSLSSLDISNFDTSNVTKMDGMFDRCSSLTSLDVSNFNTSKVTNISGMFSNCSKLTTLDVSSFDTSKVTDISGMFYNCTSLTTLDVSNFNTSNVTTMKSMFAKCLKLTHIDGLENFNTSKVTDMSLMFGASSYIGDGKIIFDNISNWDTHNVKDMTCMFYGQGAQTELDISKWNVSNCTSFNHMFCDNNKLKKLDLSKWDVSNVKTVYDMFDDCYALTTIGNVSNWNTSNMVDLGGFMNGCNNFEGSNGTLDLSGWDTSNVISMGEMFRACKKLTQIKLNNFDTSKVTDGSWTGAGSGIYYEYGNNSNEYKGMSIMFKDCPNLTSIIVGSKWSTDGKTTTNMFLNCGTDHVTIQ